MISTLAMVKIGRVYGNLMVCMKPNNNKLSKRAIRIFNQATGNLDQDRARMFLGQTKGDIKTAIVMEKTNLSFIKAKELLDHHDGYIRKALLSFGVDDSIKYEPIMGRSENIDV
jgi:N-acetylmuramic acid 6-phosphate etherase